MLFSILLCIYPGSVLEAKLEPAERAAVVEFQAVIAAMPDRAIRSERLSGKLCRLKFGNEPMRSYFMDGER